MLQRQTGGQIRAEAEEQQRSRNPLDEADTCILLFNYRKCSNKRRVPINAGFDRRRVKTGCVSIDAGSSIDAGPNLKTRMFQ